VELERAPLFITRWTFLEVSHLRMLCECTPFAPVFGYSWPLSSWTCLPLGPSVASLRSILMSLLPICAGPFLPYGLPISTWYWATATMSFVLVLPLTFSLVTLSLPTTCGILHSVFRWQVRRILFSVPMSDRIWARLSSSPVSGACRPV